MATTELKVGVFVAFSVVLMVFGYYWSTDGILAPGEAAYEVDLTVPDANGVWEGTLVELAGVKIGTIDSIGLDGNQAKLLLKIEEKYQLPTDSIAELGSSGLLGDRFVRVIPGNAETKIPDGGRLQFGEPPGDVDKIERQVSDIADDIKAITKVLREEVENDDNRRHVDATLANVDALTADLRRLAAENRQDINAIVDSVRRLTKNLEGITDETGHDVDEEMDKLKKATDTLQGTLDGMNSIADKVDSGQGTIGALVNDRATVDSLNETIDDADSVIKGFSGLHADVYYTGRYYFGTQPADTDRFFYGNPLAWSGSNTIGMELHPQEDFWWVFEINDYPQGYITASEKFYPETDYHFVEWTRDLNYRFTFQMAKRWFNWGFRLGIKEGGGGVGATYYAFKDRLKLNVDVFDFTFGSYPAIGPYGGTLPNVRLGVRWEPIDHLYFEAGTEQVLLGLKYHYATGYIGVGYHFTDDDIKLLLATLPLGSLN
jgi:phospholipid/cholesterol/gamma-HCH transport system substrate-binding protein